MFVARDLGRLPPLTFEIADTTKILKDMIVLKNEVKRIKDGYLTVDQFNDFKNHLLMEKSPSISGTRNVNMNRGAGSRDSYYCDTDKSLTLSAENGAESADMCTSTMPRSCESSSPLQDQQSTVIQLSLSRNGTKSKSVSRRSRNSYTERVENQNTHNSSMKTVNIPNSQLTPCVTAPVANRSDITENACSAINQSSFAGIVRKDGEWKYPEPTEEWKLVQRKRLKNRFAGFKGDAVTEPESNFKAADTRVPLFIYNVNKNTLASDISSYLISKTGVHVEMEQVTMKTVKEYNSFKVLVPRQKLDIFKDSKLWPDGVSFRRFVDFRKNTKSNERNKLNNNNISNG